MSGTGVAVVTDSTACLSKDCVERYSVRVIPQSLAWGGETYPDRGNIDLPTLYHRLEASKAIPVITHPSIRDFHSLFTESTHCAEALVGIFPSTRLSTTLLAASAARNLVPHRRICLFDSRSTALGLGLIVLAAARAAQTGGTLDEVVGVVERLVPAMHVLFKVDSLKYLDHSGRIGDAAPWVQAGLCIRPILRLAEGRIARTARVRTRTQAISRLLDLMGERVAGADGIHAAVFHANAPQEAVCLRDEAGARFGCRELFIAEVSPTIAVQFGAGAVGLAFYQDGSAIR